MFVGGVGRVAFVSDCEEESLSLGIGNEVGFVLQWNGKRRSVFIHCTPRSSRMVPVREKQNLAGNEKW